MKSLVSKIALISLLALVVVLFSGCNVLQKLGFGKNDMDEIQPVSFVYMGELDAAKISNKTPVKLYFTNEDNSKLLAEIRYISFDRKKNGPENKATEILIQLIKGPGEGTGLKPTIPQGTKIHSPIKVEGKIATVDLSKEFIENHSGEKEAEKTTIYSIVNSLTQVNGIEKIQFKIEGEKQERFKGNFKFDAPFPGSPALNSKEPPVKGKNISSEIDADQETSGQVDQDQETSGEIEESQETSGEIEESQETSGQLEQEILE